MCLSNVYKNDASADNLLYRNIADVRIDGTKIILTDLMGIRSEIEGSIEKVDLMENYIIVRDI
ncbi:MAG: CooT family nickel-binding protein [Clostridiales bacterium]|nr:CooT family nickel-binding protein [Candidatus Crickella caballi]